MCSSDLHCNGWVNDLRITPVAFLDTLGYESGIGYEQVNPQCGVPVPDAQIMRQQRKQLPDWKTGCSQVFTIHIPKITHRGMAITNMQSIRPHDHAFGRSRFGADNQIIAAQIQLLQRQRHQRQISLIKLLSPRQPIDESRLDVPLAQTGRDSLFIQHMGIDISFRVQLAQCLQHPLAAAHVDEPVMDDGGFFRHKAFSTSESYLIAGMKGQVIQLT